MVVRDAAQVIVDEADEAVERIRVTLAPLANELCDLAPGGVGHGRRPAALPFALGKGVEEIHER
jgi:hypothetical protein